METAWLIYWYLVAGKIVISFFWISFSAVLTYLIVLISKWIAWSDRADFHGSKESVISWVKMWKILVLPFFIACAVKAFYPNKDDLAYIFGGAALVSVAQTEEAKKLPDNILKAANVFLEGVAEDK